MKSEVYVVAENGVTCFIYSYTLFSSTLAHYTLCSVMLLLYLHA